MDADEEAGGDYKPWSEIFEDRQGKHPATLNLKVAIYLYLLMRGPDYGYNIHKAFVDAEKEGKWETQLRLKDLTGKKSSSKVSAALKYMADIGILCDYKDVIKYLPKSLLIENRFKEESKKNPTLRVYYIINYEVIADYGFAKNGPKNILKQHLTNLGVTGEVEDWDLVEFHRLIWHAIMIIQGYGKTEQDIIKYINGIPKYDYLTILLVFDSIIQDLENSHIRNLVRPSKEPAKRNWLEKQKSVFFNDDDKIHQMIAKYGKKIQKWECIYDEKFQKIISNMILEEVRKERLPTNRKMKNGC